MMDILGGFWKSKSIKLSDAFGVYINHSDDYLINCTGFTLPKLEYREETQLYGNTGQTFLIPNYESYNKLTLDFYEETNDKMTKFLEDKFSFKLTQKYDSDYGLSINKAYYNLIPQIDSIQIKIADNWLKKWIYLYNFRQLKIIDYTLYDLDYQNESPCKINITFGFESYYIEELNEEIKYDINSNKPKTIKPSTLKNKNKNNDDIYVESDNTKNRNK